MSRVTHLCQSAVVQRAHGLGQIAVVAGVGEVQRLALIVAQHPREHCRLGRGWANQTRQSPASALVPHHTPCQIYMPRQNPLRSLITENHACFRKCTQEFTSLFTFSAPSCTDIRRDKLEENAFVVTHTRVLVEVVVCATCQGVDAHEVLKVGDLPPLPLPGDVGLGEQLRRRPQIRPQPKEPALAETKPACG